MHININFKGQAEYPNSYIQVDDHEITCVLWGEYWFDSIEARNEKWAAVQNNCVTHPLMYDGVDGHPYLHPAWGFFFKLKDGV